MNVALELNNLVLAGRPKSIELDGDKYEEYVNGLQGIQKEKGICFMGIPVTKRIK